MSEWCSCNPLIDAQSKAAKWDAIVRCRDCRFGRCGGEACALNHSEDFDYVEPDGFCFWGERKDGE